MSDSYTPTGDRVDQDALWQAERTRLLEEIARHKRLIAEFTKMNVRMIDHGVAATKRAEKAERATGSACPGCAELRGQVAGLREALASARCAGDPRQENDEMIRKMGMDPERATSEAKHAPDCASFDFDPEKQLGPDKACDCGLGLVIQPLEHHAPQCALRRVFAQRSGEDRPVDTATAINRAVAFILELPTLTDEMRAIACDALREYDQLMRLRSEAAPPCTCGSGGHPRECAKHPLAKELHCAEMSLENVTAERDALEAELAATKKLLASALEAANVNLGSAEASPVLTIDMQTPRPKVGGEHVHRCPVCYEAVPCRETCDIEMDLTLDDGTPCGAYATCDKCKADEEPCCWGLKNHAPECPNRRNERATRSLALVIAGAVPKHVVMMPDEVREVARLVLARRPDAWGDVGPETCMNCGVLHATNACPRKPRRERDQPCDSATATPKSSPSASPPGSSGASAPNAPAAMDRAFGIAPDFPLETPSSGVVPGFITSVDLDAEHGPIVMVRCFVDAARARKVAEHMITGAPVDVALPFTSPAPKEKP